MLNVDMRKEYSHYKRKNKLTYVSVHKTEKQRTHNNSESLTYSG